MKKVKMAVLGTVLCAASALNVVTVVNAEKANDFSTTSLLAIGEGNPNEGGSNEGGGPNEGGSNEGSSTEGGNVSSTSRCDVLVYNIGYMEITKVITITDSIKFNGGISRLGKFIHISGEVGHTVIIPDCKESEQNCCAKSHLDKPVQYIF